MSGAVHGDSAHNLWIRQQELANPRFLGELESVDARAALAY